MKKIILKRIGASTRPLLTESIVILCIETRDYHDRSKHNTYAFHNIILTTSKETHYLKATKQNLNIKGLLGHFFVLKVKWRVKMFLNMMFINSFYS